VLELSLPGRIRELLVVLELKTLLHKVPKMPKDSEFVEVEMVNFTYALLELADSQLGVAEVGLNVRIKSLHRFDA
jgi:hypothetical protein